MPVWLIIAHLHVVGDDVTQVAADYALPSEAVEAALAYYRRHKTSLMPVSLPTLCDVTTPVANFYTDHDVALQLAVLLRQHGDMALTAALFPYPSL